LPARFRHVWLIVAAAMACPMAPGIAPAQTWALNGNGNWGTAGNWSPATTPNAVGAAVTFGPGMTGNRTVTANIPITLGSVAISGSRTFTIAGANPLTFDVASGLASVTSTATVQQTFSAPIVLNDTLSIVNTSTAALTFSGVISGAGGLTANGGSQTVNLNGANTYTGATTITNGTVSYGTGSAIPAASAVRLGDGVGAAGTARLNINASMTGAQGFALSTGSDGLLVQGNNRFVRLGSVAGTGELRVNAAVGNGFEFTGTADADFAGRLTGGTSTNSSNPDSGSRVIKSGAATQTLSGNNSAYIGRIFVNGGSLRAASATALGTSSAGFNNATFVYGTGSLELGGGITTSERFYLNGAGNGGAGALGSFSGNNVATGNITLGWSGGTVTASNASIGVDAGSTLTVTGTISGANRLTKVGDGTLIVNTAGTWTGGTTFAAGVLRLGVATGVPTASALTFSGGTFDLNGFNRTITSLSGTGGIMLGSAVLTVNQTAAGQFTGPISGTGSLTKTGAADLRLVGTNSYSGGTTVSAGSLTGDSASLQGAITNNATVVFDQAAAGTYGGVMSGSGSLTKTGVGALRLTGANTYSGGTTVAQGELVGTTTSLQSNIVNNAAVTFDQIAAGTYGGVMSGGGSLAKTGAGALRLTGANSYSGGTTVSGGELVGTTTSLQGDIVNNAAVTFDEAAAGTYGGVMSGSGSLTKTGVGALRLTGANSYSGGTTISGGTLIGTASSLQGDIANSAALVFDQTIAGAFSGAISGSGSLTKTGAADLRLVGTNSYSGGTTVSAGSLTGDSASLQGAITNNATVVFDQAAAGTYGGAMSGSGSLTKTGVGALRLTGANSFAGGTVVEAGTLSVDGSIGGPLIVDAGATLGGRGLVGDVQVLTGGTIAPGNSIGTLRLATLNQSGDYALEYRAPAAGYAFTPSGTGQSIRGRNSLLDAGLAATDQDADLIAVAGTAMLGAGSTVTLARLGDDLGFLSALNDPGNTNRELRYLILRADGGVTGRYVALSESGSTLEYLGAGVVNDVWLVLRGPDTPVLTNRAPAPFALPMQGDRPRCDLEAVAGGAQRCAFVQGDFGSFDSDAAGAAPGTDATGWSGTVGFGAEVSDDLWLGIALGRENGDADLTDGSGSADYDRTEGTIWANWQTAGIEVRGWLGFGGYDVSSDRATSTGAVAQADYDANRTTLAVELRRWHSLADGMEVTPLLGLGAADFETDAYSETGGGIENFSTESQSQWSLRSLIGVEGRWRVKATVPVVLDASLGWSHEFGDNTLGMSGTYEGDATGTVLTSATPAFDRNEVVAGLGATFALDRGQSLRVEYGIRASGDVTDQGAMLRWSSRF
jgi:autotransporter-associated beta strand protein